ncbi:MAG: nucleotidyltransferase domain-containing protein [Firmicutes bacterium]|nr:nucleotidyltransferase domain-containing protein [Bacillota bacterium]
MADLVTIDHDTIMARVAAVLKDFPQVAGAYLFGSALAKCRPDSDIDIALVPEDIELTEREKMRLEDEVAAHFTPLAGHFFDIVLLDPNKPVFGYQVLREGRLIYDRNHERVTDVMEMVSRGAADLYPRYRAALDEIMAEVMKGERQP